MPVFIMNQTELRITFSLTLSLSMYDNLTVRVTKGLALCAEKRLERILSVARAVCPKCLRGCFSEAALYRTLSKANCQLIMVNGSGAENVTGATKGASFMHAGILLKVLYNLSGWFSHHLRHNGHIFCYEIFYSNDLLSNIFRVRQTIWLVIYLNF